MTFEELMQGFSGIIPSRSFNLAYIILDSVFLVAFMAFLLLKKRYIVAIWSIIGGLLYLGVDFGIFHCLTATRHIYYLGADNLWYEMSLGGHFWTLLWLSFAYGIPNFAFIWMALGKDKLLKYVSIIIMGWWLVVPSLSSFGGEATIITQRMTGDFHWIMAILFIIGYATFICFDVFSKRKLISILKLNAIGIITQFAWEFALLVTGIRPWNEQSIKTLLVNSFLETNTGMPYFYLIFVLVTHKWNEDLTPKKELGPLFEFKKPEETY